MVFAGAKKSSGGIASRIVRAAGAQGIIQLVRVGQLFLLVPVCLTAWGTAVYEDWVLLNSITAFLVLSDLGLIQFTAVRLLDAWSKGEQERFSREWGVGLGLIGMLSAALMCVLGVCWADPAWSAFVPVRELQATELVSITVMLALAQVWSILIFLGLAAYRARGDLSRSYHVWSIMLILQTAGIALPAWVGEGPGAAAAGTAIGTGMILLAVAADLRWRYPDLTWKPIWPSLSELYLRVRGAIGYLASPVYTTIMSNAPNLVLAHSGAPEGAIALFTATRTIAGVARQLPYQFAHPAGVELAALLARGDRESLFRVYADSSRVLAMLVGVLGGFTVIAAPLVMALWTRGKIVYDLDLMLLLVGTTVICAPAQVAYTLLWYGGYPGPLNRALLFSTGLALGSAILLAPFFAARGVAAGLGIGEIAGWAVYLSLLVDRLVHRKPGTGLLWNIGVALLAFLSSAATGYLLDLLIEPHGWFGLIELGAAWAISAAIGVYWGFLSGPQQARVAAVVSGFVPSRKPKSNIKNANPADLG
jgi:O-antigen/teichoic acid export membrane protein